MFLKTLTLRGFKSFADPTTLEFEPGVTVVVGPNGSGKSNVVDAVAWVLGAQGPRTLRGAKMDDVIFAGTAKRPPLGRAEVSLTIDNSARRLPIDFAEVTVTRTLFRSGESEYALNGTTCRLLDIQELFSDTGVGRQQHVIVGQGQLDTILAARPEDRRAVIEEAAGVLKYRRRRERAERRLVATEGDLVRLQDLLREVRRQLKPLQQQAEAARRRGELEAELGALRLYLAGRDLLELDRRGDASAAAAARLEAEEQELRSRRSVLDEVLAAGEGLLEAARSADVSGLLARAEAVRERARGMAGLIAERRRSAVAALAAATDQSVVAAREAEAAAVAAELSQAEHEAVGLAPEWAGLEAEEARLAAERAALEARFSPAGAPTDRLRGPQYVETVSRAPATLRTELVQARGEASRLREELARVHERVAALEGRAAELREAATRAEQARAAAAGAVGGAVEAHDTARAEHDLAAAAAAATADGLRRAEQAHHSASARAEALAQALDEARARAGLEQLAGVRGVLGTLLDAVRLEKGYELAFEAAAESALEAVVVADLDAGREALAELRRARGGGAVLVAGLPLERSAAGPALDAAAAGAGAGVEPLLRRVEVTEPAVAATVEWLLRDVACLEGGFEQACDLALRVPGLTVVTRDGDRFGPGGWRVGAGRAGATRAALDEATAAAEAAASAVAAAVTAAEETRLVAEAAATMVAETGRRREHIEADLRRHTASCEDLAAQGELTGSQLAGARSTAEELGERAEEAGRHLESLEAQLAELEQSEAEALGRLAEERTARNAVEDRGRAVASLRADLEVRAAGLEERRRLLGGRLAEVQEWLRRNEEGRQEAAARRVALESNELALGRLGRSVEAAAGRLADVAGRLRAERDRQEVLEREAGERLGQARRERATVEESLAAVRERRQRLEIEATEIRMRREAAEQSVRSDLDREPAEAKEAARPELPPGVTPAQRAREVDRDLRSLGPVNALAEEELVALEERHAFLGGQLDDVRSARRELGGVVRAVDAEISAMFEAAFADVAGHFEALFGRLFPGGSGRLVRTDGESPLEGGVEIEARPAGRNVRRLSLLSGGERSLVALAFLFAVFRSRPSPFYLMDEVEAALDDVNLHRFLDLVDEFREEAQLIVVSHQKRTMEAADVLYGVTMQPGGSSRVVSERVSPGG